MAAPLAKGMMKKHFGDDRNDANTVLTNLGIVDGLNGMNFNRSTIFSKNSPDEIHLAVYYRLKLFSFFKWTDLEVPMCKESRARAWLGGVDVATSAIAAPSTPASGEEGDGGAKGVEESDEEESDDDEIELPDSLQAYLDEHAGDKEALIQLVEEINANGGASLSDVEILYRFACEYSVDFDALKISDQSENVWTIETLRTKIYDTWNPDYRPSREIYDEYIDVYENPNYFNQETGGCIWPECDGFDVDKPIEYETLKAGFVFLRFGDSTGKYLEIQQIHLKVDR